MTSALKAGWICFGIGMLLSWFFPLGNVFFSVAIITSIVAMCTHRVNRGLALLVTAFVGMAVSAVMFFILVIGTAAVVAGPAMKKANAEVQRSREAQDRALQQIQRSQQQMQSALSNAANHVSAPQFNTAPTYDAAADRRRQYEIAMQQKGGRLTSRG